MRRTLDPLPDSGKAWNLAGPLCKSGVAFPLTPALSLGEREKHPPRDDKSPRPDILSDGQRGTFSLRERAGVRGKWAYVVPTGCLQQLNALFHLTLTLFLRERA